MSVSKSTTIRTTDNHFDIEVIRTPTRAIIAIHDTLLDRVMPPIVLTPDQAEALARALRDEPGAEDTHAD